MKKIEKIFNDFLIPAVLTLIVTFLAYKISIIIA